MSSCCSPSPHSSSTGKFFSKRSKWYARSFRNGKLEPSQRSLVREICREPIEGRTILDIGSGVGTLHLTLLQRGAAFATGVDMSEAMIEHAKTFGKNLGLNENTSYIIGDFLPIADTIPSADITLLDKVICCYEDVDGLIRRSAEKTNCLYALIYPADNFIVHFIFSAEIAIAKLFRSGFRPYWHDWITIPTLVQRQHFMLSHTESTLLWRTDVYKRVITS